MAAEPLPALVLVIDPEIGDRERAEILAAAERARPGALVTEGDGWAAVALGDGPRIHQAESFSRLPGVLRVVPVSKPFRLAALEVLGHRKTVRLELGSRVSPIGHRDVGNVERLTVMVECSPPERISSLVHEVRDAGADLLFAGEFGQSIGGSARTEQPDIGALRSLAEEMNLGLCVEVSDASHIEQASRLASLLQVGGRNMQDFRLLRAIGQATCPVLLKRGPGATVEEFILAAEYALIHGNGRVILCESGIRTFDSVWKPRLEINAIPLLWRATHLPVFADTSATPDGALVPSVARAAVAAGADGLVLKVRAGEIRDGDADIDLSTFARLMQELRAVAAAAGRNP